MKNDGSLFTGKYLTPESSGPEVAVLQVFLLGRKCPGVRVTGIYDQNTAHGVSLLQKDLGFHQEKDRDGEFGYETMSALRARERIDFGEITGEVFFPDSYAP